MPDSLAAQSDSRHYDVIILGGGAAGLMCAISAGRRGKSVLVLERANRIGKKILMSGGGRCNFTHLETTPDNFISRNPHFCKSALARYTPWDFLALVHEHGIAWHEKSAGQLFCDHSSKDIVAMLAAECGKSRVKIRTQCDVTAVSKDDLFRVSTSLGYFSGGSLVVATGGLSIPRMGASDYGHRLARQFGLTVLPLRAGLVPFTLAAPELEHCAQLSGVSVEIQGQTDDGTTFGENMLFTHRGLSGPCILQLSSYWHPGEALTINFLPDQDPLLWLDEQRQTRPRQTLRNALAQPLSKRLADLLCDYYLTPAVAPDSIVADLTKAQMQHIGQRMGALKITPNGTEGYRTAEVTLGGVDTSEISSKTMQAHAVAGLYFIGEVLDVTGHLGGHNFQWAWASGWCAGEAV